MNRRQEANLDAVGLRDEEADNARKESGHCCHQCNADVRAEKAGVSVSPRDVYGDFLPHRLVNFHSCQSFVASLTTKIVVTAPVMIDTIVATSFNDSLFFAGGFLGTITKLPASGSGSHHMLFAGSTLPFG